MLTTERKVIMVEVELDENECEVLYDTDFIITSFLEILNDNQGTELVSIPTGEIITKEDFCRLRGILSSLSMNTYWSIEKGAKYEY